MASNKSVLLLCMISAAMAISARAADLTPSESFDPSQAYEVLKESHVYAQFSTRDTCGLQIVSVTPSKSLITFRYVNNPITGFFCEASAALVTLRCNNATCWQSEQSNDVGYIFTVDVNGNFQMSIGWCGSDSLGKFSCQLAAHYLSRIQYSATDSTSNPRPTKFTTSFESRCRSTGDNDDIQADKDKAVKVTRESAMAKCLQFYKSCKVDEAQSEFHFYGSIDQCNTSATAIKK